MAEWVTDMMNSLGYLGIGVLMFLENLFPPIPSELIMPLAGFTVSQGEMSFVPAVAAGVIGTMLGALPWYYIGAVIGEPRLKQWADRYGRWLGITSADISKSRHWFDRYGGIAVFLGRLVPGVRTLISLPAGFSNMPLLPFLAYSVVGTTIWTGLLTYAGLVLGQNYELVEVYLGPVSKIVLLILVLSLIAWIILKQMKRKMI